MLVVDDKPFQRRLTIETLRTMRNVVVEYVENADYCIESMALFQPDVVVTTWDMEGSDGVEMTQRIRAGEGGHEYRRTPVVLVTERGRLSDIARARSAGVNEFVQTPFSTVTLLRRVRETQRRTAISSRAQIMSAPAAGAARRKQAMTAHAGACSTALTRKPIRRTFKSARV
jgi:CheY-like chemotaxis protein